MAGTQDIRVTRRRLRFWRWSLVAIVAVFCIGNGVVNELTNTGGGSGWTHPIWVNGIRHQLSADVAWSGNGEPARMSAAFTIDLPMWHNARYYRRLEPVASYPLTIESFSGPGQATLRRADGTMMIGVTLAFDGENTGWSDPNDPPLMRMHEEQGIVIPVRANREIAGAPFLPGTRWYVKGVLISSALGALKGAGPAVLLILLVLFLTQESMYIRRAPHECQSCGYDLRGGGDVCPECGAARCVE